MNRSTLLLVSLLMTAGMIASGCGSQTETTRTERIVDRYNDSARRVVEIVRADTVVETRRYRRTGSLLQIERADSTADYLEIHSIDSAYVLKDYMLGRWTNVDADADDPNASATYIFGPNELTFRNPDGEVIESIGIEYDDLRTLYTADGMPVTAEIAGFDTVRVTGFTLVRDGFGDGALPGSANTSMQTAPGDPGRQPGN